MKQRGRARRRWRRQRAEERRALMRGRRAALQYVAGIRRRARVAMRSGHFDDRVEAQMGLRDVCGKGRGGDRWVVRDVRVRLSDRAIDWPRGTLLAAEMFWFIVRGFRAEHVDRLEIPF